MDDRNIFIHKVVTVASRLVMLGSGIGSIIYLTHKLGIAGYGEYASLIAIAMLIRFPAESLFHSALPFMASEKNPEFLGSAILRALATSGLLFGAISMIIGVIAPELLRIESPKMWFAMCCEIFFALIANGYMGVIIGRNHFLASSLIFSTYWVGRLLISVTLVELGFGTLGALTALSLASIVVFALCAATDRCHTLFSSPLSWKELWNKSKIYSMSMILERLLNSCDLVAMKLFNANPLAIGYYATGLSLSQAFQTIAKALYPVQLQMLAYYRSAGQQAKFDSLAQSMIVENLRMIGLAILGLPFLPVVIHLLLGKDISNTQAVFALIIAAASFQLMFTTGRIFNVASGDLSQMRLILFLVLILQSLGFGIAANIGGQSNDETTDLAITQAICCAVVSIVSNLALALIALNAGLRRSKQPFPWVVSLRVLGLASLLATLGILCLNLGLSAFLILPLCTVAYVGLLILFGDLPLPDSLFTRRKTRDESPHT
jgi:O-antigen/teichoic acid export membrane protein